MEMEMDNFLTRNQRKHIRVRPSPIIQTSVSDDAIIDMLKTDNVVSKTYGPALPCSSGSRSKITYFKAYWDGTLYYVKVVDDPGATSYSCCGGIYAEYSTVLDDLKASSVGWSN